VLKPFKPTMTATAAVGTIPTCIYNTETAQLTLNLIKDETFLNVICHNNNKSSDTFHSMNRHVETTVANSTVTAATSNHHEQQFPINLVTIQQEIQQELQTSNITFCSLNQLCTVAEDPSQPGETSPNTNNAHPYAT